MKNIFLIPTPNESRLWRDLDSNKLTFTNLSNPNSNECTKCSNEYVYITSDEKFIRDEYITDGLEVIKATPKLVDAQGLVDRRGWKKIVMTNDLELIGEGIQQIGEKFFEWLVLNPYCKEVEVRHLLKSIFDPKTNQKYPTVQHNHFDLTKMICKYNYELIIPKKNFYCGDEVDYGEQCSFQCDGCVDATGVDYGYLPKEDLGYTTKIGIKVVDGMVRPLMVPKEYFGKDKVYNNSFHYQTRWLLDFLSDKDYLTDKREVIEKEFEEYLKK